MSDKMFEESVARGIEKAAYKIKSDTTLQPHQKRIKERLKNVDAILAYHEIGSGKTLSAIGAAEGMKPDFVVPASLRENIKNEFRKFTEGPTPPISSYEKMVNKGLGGGNFLVVDEVHRAGGEGTTRSKKLIDVAPTYDKRLLMTGSPIRNRPSELAPIIRALNPESDIPLEAKKFADRYVKEIKKPVGFWGWIRGERSKVEYDIKNEEDFLGQIKGLIDFQPADKTTFPERTDELIKIPMSEQQYKAYSRTIKGVPKSVRKKMDSGEALTAGERLHLNSFLNASRRVSNSLREFGINEDSPKINAAVSAMADELSSGEKKKGLVYSNFIGAGVREYASMLDDIGIPHEVFDGSIGDAERKRIQEDFNSDKTRTLLISGAGAEGLDLKGTSLIQVLEPHWNTARIEQAVGRGIRRGSHEALPEEDRKVKVQKFISVQPKSLFRRKGSKSIDEFLMSHSENKDVLNEKFLELLRAEGIKEASESIFSKIAREIAVEKMEKMADIIEAPIPIPRQTTEDLKENLIHQASRLVPGGKKWNMERRSKKVPGISPTIVLQHVLKSRVPVGKRAESKKADLAGYQPPSWHSNKLNIGTKEYNEAKNLEAYKASDYTTNKLIDHYEKKLSKFTEKGDWESKEFNDLDRKLMEIAENEHKIVWAGPPSMQSNPLRILNPSALINTVKKRMGKGEQR